MSQGGPDDEIKDVLLPLMQEVLGRLAIKLGQVEISRVVNPDSQEGLKPVKHFVEFQSGIHYFVVLGMTYQGREFEEHIKFTVDDHGNCIPAYSKPSFCEIIYGESPDQAEKGRLPEAIKAPLPILVTAAFSMLVRVNSAKDVAKVLPDLVRTLGDITLRLLQGDAGLEGTKKG